MKYTLQILLIYVCMNLFAQEHSWYWQLPNPYGYDISDIHVFNDSSIIMIGETGICLSSDDSGQTWIQNKSIANKDVYYHTISFYNNYVGWILSTDEGRVLKTIDRGKNWFYQETNSKEIFSSIDIIDSNNVWIGSKRNGLFKSNDGGESWEHIVIDTVLNSAIVSIDFISKDTGWIVYQKNGVYKTIDGGKNWTLQLADQDISVEVISDNLMFAFTKTIQYKSIDGGKNWIDKSVTNWNSISDVEFLNKDTGFVLSSTFISGDSGSIWKTIDGGKSWIQFPLKKNEHPNGMNFINSSYGWIVGYCGMTMVTYNGCEELQRKTLNIGEDLNSIDFISNNTGWAAGNSGIVLKTSNGGIDWENCNYNFGNVHFKKISFIDSLVGWLGGGKGEVYKTIDGGASWSSYTIKQNYIMNDYFFLDNKYGWAITSSYQYRSNTIYYTNDGGDSWSVRSNNIGSTLESIYFVDSLIGWGEPEGIGIDTIYKTIDGGETWQKHYINMGPYKNGWTNSLFFINRDIGWTVGAWGKIYKTINGGETWNELENDIVDDLYAVKFVNELKGWVAGNMGVIYFTNDGGESWVREDDKAFPCLKDITYVDDSRIWAVGNNGTIVSTYNDGQSKIHDNVNFNHDVKFCKVLQLGSDKIKILFKKSVSTNSLNVSVFNMLGKKIDISPIIDNQSITINTNNFSSGIYMFLIKNEFGTNIEKVNIIK